MFDQLGERNEVRCPRCGYQAIGVINCFYCDIQMVKINWGFVARIDNGDGYEADDPRTFAPTANGAKDKAIALNKVVLDIIPFQEPQKPKPPVPFRGIILRIG